MSGSVEDFYQIIVLINQIRLININRTTDKKSEIACKTVRRRNVTKITTKEITKIAPNKSLPSSVYHEIPSTIKIANNINAHFTQILVSVLIFGYVK